jgi:hypothetical protein
MKKIIIASLFVAVTANLSFAQWERRNVDDDFLHSSLQVQAGLNGWQLVGLLDEIDAVEEVNIRTTGTYGLSYDYYVIKNFSVGANLSYNRLVITSPSIDLSIRGQSYSGRVRANVGRTNLGVRLLGHYVNNERFGLYSGLRGGFNWYRAGAELETDSFESVDVVEAVLDKLGLDFFGLQTGKINGTRPTIQVIPIGARIGFTENVGMTVETALGPTSYLSLGLNARF